MKRTLNNAAKIRQISLCLLASLVCCARVRAGEVDISKLPPAATVQIDFARDIKPILETSCIRCHGPEKPKGDFRLDNRKAALKGGEAGMAILPGDSAKSLLIHYVGYLVEDSEMPPVGKGEQLTAEQVALLRAWIDQGLIWEDVAPTNAFHFSFSPIMGGTTVSGDSRKFREHYWQKDGLNPGLEQFELSKQINPDTKLFLTGHALLDDYKIVLTVDRNDFGFIHSGWEEYRKYYDDTGGYYPSLISHAPSLGEDLHLDIGKVWVDFGLTLPDWPRLVLGYEYDYKRGNEAITQWGAVGADPTARSIAPASKGINEGVHIIKFDLNAEIKGFSIEESFHGEFYKLENSGRTNLAANGSLQSVNEGTAYFQGVNTLRLEKKFRDWFFGSAGYLYSKLNADSSFSMESPTELQRASVPKITLEKESHVGNVNGLLGPFDGLVISTGAQAEWTRQHSLGAGIFDQDILTDPISHFLVPFNLASDYDETSLQETLAVRYSKIPFTSLFAEALMEQRNVGQYDQFSASQNILNKAVFLQHTDFSSQLSDLRFGFTTSPWRSISFSAHYRRRENDSQYDSDPLMQPAKTAYPTFITSRDLLTDEVEAKIVLHPFARFKTSLSYQYKTTDYAMATGHYIPFGNVISPGGEFIAGKDDSHIVSINTTFTPVPRLSLSTTFSYQASTTTTDAAGSPTVAPYRGDIYSVLANGTYVLSPTTDLFANYSFSKADYGQNNFSSGLPLGIQYQQYNVQLGLTHRLGKNVTTKLQYRFASYDEPSSGGANNYRAHSIFGTLNFQFQ